MQLFPNILVPKNFKAEQKKRFAPQFAFVQKTRAQNVDEINSR
jgi:hypothetical protein